MKGLGSAPPFPWMLLCSILLTCTQIVGFAFWKKLEEEAFSMNQTSAVYHKQHCKLVLVEASISSNASRSQQTHQKAHGGWVSLTQIVSYWQLDVSRFVKASGGFLLITHLCTFHFWAAWNLYIGALAPRGTIGWIHTVVSAAPWSQLRWRLW